MTAMASFTDTTTATLPSIAYQVADEYGRVQPVGMASLVPQPNGSYSVSLPVGLEAKVRSGDKDGRQYTVSVTVGDDGTSKTGSAVVTAAPPARQASAAQFEIGFLKGMIPHHQMAISMSQIALRNSDNPEVRGLARRIIGEQRPEIAEMRSWLSWYGIRGFRPGMSPDDMQMLRDLRGLHGTAFDRAYLSDMIDHHRRAIGGDGMMMTGAEDVLAHGGIHPRLTRLAGNIVRTQAAEIREMRMLLGTGATVMPHMHG